MTKRLLIAAVVLLAGACAWAFTPLGQLTEMAEAGAIKSWSSDETITGTDINANFAHIHSRMVGGHGGRLVDADVSAAASISTSKLAAYRLIPVAWATANGGGVNTACSASPCTIAAGTGITSVTRTGAGDYTVNFTSSRTNVNYNTIVSAGAPSQTFCNSSTPTAASVLVKCCDMAGTPTDTTFSVTILDND